MLIIPQTQLNAFDAAARAQFVDEVTQLLHEAHLTLADDSEPVMPGPTAEDRQEVEILAQKAESFGLREHASIGVFLQVAFHIGSDFYDVFTPVKEVLRSRLLDEDAKRGWLEKWYASLLDPDTNPITETVDSQRSVE